MQRSRKYSQLLSLFVIGFMMLVLNNGCRNPEDDPVASFSVSNFTPIINENVTFTNTSKNAHHVKWTFPDGNTSGGNTLSYSFKGSGIYNVKLEAFDKNETLKDVHEESISVCVSGKAVFYADSVTFKTPINISFNGAFAGTITTFTQGVPVCGQLSAITVEICPGTYTYEATDANNKVWKNSVKITANSCVAIKLN